MSERIRITWPATGLSWLTVAENWITWFSKNNMNSNPAEIDMAAKIRFDDVDIVSCSVVKIFAELQARTTGMPGELSFLQAYSFKNFIYPADVVVYIKSVINLAGGQVLFDDIILFCKIPERPSFLPRFHCQRLNSIVGILT